VFRQKAIGLKGNVMMDLKLLRERCEQGETFEYLFFWGHSPPKSGGIAATCFSQWYDAGFEIDGVFYPTAEHWMMAAKARLFEDEDMLLRIIDADSPKAAKALGRKVRKFDDKRWKANARRLVTAGNVAKFTQNAELGEFLQDTGSQVLVEASPYDRIWGIGLRSNDPRAEDPASWQGQNLLGFALMDVRAAM